MGKENGQKVTSELEKIINEGRDRKKNEALAARIFGKDRRASTPLSGPSSLASRAGVKKHRAVSSTVSRPSAGNIDSEWTHDLHSSQAPPTGPRSQRNNGNGPKPSSLASRITNPNAGIAGNREKRRAAQVAQALIRTKLQPASARYPAPAQAIPSSSLPVTPAADLITGRHGGSTFQKGMTIRGLAGPYVVMAQNFAPGTTAADIESAMTPIGGIITSCRVVKNQPIVIAEIVFESKEGADNVIATFHSQTADGRVLSVYPKVGNTPSAVVVDDDDAVVDGTMGFDDPMDSDDLFANGRSNGRQPPRAPAAGNGGGGLYSDNMVHRRPRDRGSNRGGGAGR
ncbi:hypothetical protein B0T26DRAFT_674669 [Lasiosphaeria miniovina]|uniref:RRM domain-containing protein n=1 Tax=Lasiosphaeria miniovina TaxID=1954250 RepID=A0AA40E2Y6_9PEZI|nr:uncharacterized protein B0T26DRAFT_674669 [Lasiosphaeria miniovina]KAK0723052.1 hypothetical protein B0T26DRAFT_674669 [Lasiosphaeria miniovina]